MGQVCQLRPATEFDHLPEQFPNAIKVVETDISADIKATDDARHQKGDQIEVQINADVDNSTEMMV